MKLKRGVIPRPQRKIAAQGASPGRDGLTLPLAPLSRAGWRWGCMAMRPYDGGYPLSPVRRGPDSIGGLLTDNSGAAPFVWGP
jgi:hypothetical protein